MKGYGWVAVSAIGLVAVALGTPSARADACNLKVVTDANPDYSDIGSFIYSATSNWSEDRDKVWAVFYWNHIGRRQTMPMYLHGLALADPIRQFNDYGYTMCSTISGNNMAIFGAMGLRTKYWDISNHTVMEVEYDGKFHLIDNSLSALYTLCDGQTLAGVDEIGQDGACEASGGKVAPGHIAKYHCLHATGPNGFLTGGDTIRSVADEYACFNPGGLKYRHYYSDWDYGHRYTLNLRDNEVYTRHYRRLDAESADAIPQPKDSTNYRADPAYFTPNGQSMGDEKVDPESVNPRYRIRGNGVRNYTPDLSAAALARNVWSMDGVTATVGGVTPATAGKAGSVIFRVEGANVITSLKIRAELTRKAATDQAVIAVSTDHGRSWRDVHAADLSGSPMADLKLITEVNGSYAVLVRVSLLGQAAAADAALKSIAFETLTQINSKTQPKLRLGKNTIYVGTGAPTQSVVLWPDLRGDAWKPLVVDSKNIATFKDERTGKPDHPAYMAVMFAEKADQDAYVVFKLDTPGDLTGLTYGGRFYNRSAPGHVDLLHSFDGGKTWTNTYSLTDVTPPWDVIRYETAKSVPKGVRSVLVKYLWNAKQGAGPSVCGLYAVRMEANYAPADSSFKPLEVAFTWKEIQTDYTTVERSHVQRVDRVPATYAINVGGADHPVVESLRVNPVGAQPPPATYGYGDGKDVGGEEFQDRWMSVGKVLSVGKPYTATEVSLSNWGAGDPDGKKLTDGVVGSTYNGGVSYSYGVVYDAKQKPEVTVDLGTMQDCGAFRIQVGGWEPWDALKGEIKDQVEVLTSLDGQNFTSVGSMDFSLRWKDIPANFMWPDEETMVGYNAPLILSKPVSARHVRFKITPARILAVSEVQVLDRISFAPFDLRIALPDGRDRSDITAYPLRHDPSAEYKRVRKLMGPEGGKVVGTID